MLYSYGAQTSRFRSLPLPSFWFLIESWKVVRIIYRDLRWSPQSQHWNLPRLCLGHPKPCLENEVVIHPQALQGERAPVVWTELCISKTEEYLHCATCSRKFPKQDHNSLKKSNHISPTPSDSSPKTLQINFPNDLEFLTFACTNMKAFQFAVSQEG